MARYRSLRRMTLRDMAARMTEVGRPMGHATLNEIENGARRVDVDDLTALAGALNVSPASLLMPYSTDPHDETVVLTGAPLPASSPFAGGLWEWLTAEAPLGADPTADRDEFEIERWRRDAAPAWTWRTLRREDTDDDA
ncbi:helix-turn-helix domain-containing protein [Williamsia muralis]|uniref:Helix-turn-helix domain-containing protein n=1 Tax=Williamsia marianensis TaxID=85044 RepID=A0ABU4F0Y7_WILMA|nr:helix-turn-helix domain-containing protein [Williamsia muralis]MDV7137175.1 helix-turn-helix domain-containing protein [Williamsia muralis]